MKDVDVLISEKCSRCQHGQKVSYTRRLCDYGTQAIPIDSMRHPLGMCGIEAKLFEKVNRYSEFDV